MPGEQGLERLDVAHDVDHRLRSPGIGRHRRRRPEDPQQRIETTLRIGPRQQRRRRIRTVQLRASSDVGAELVFDEPLEDAQHLRRVQRPPSARPQVDATVDLVQPGGAVGVIRLGVIEGAVLIGEVLPPPHDGAEVLEREMLGVFEQEVEHVDQARSAAWIAAGPGEFDDLRPPDMAGQQRLSNGGAGFEQGDDAPHGRHVAPGPVGVRPHPALDRAMAVIAVHTTCIRHRDHRCHLCLDAATFQLELTEPLGDRVVVEPHQLFDEFRVHG